MDENLINEVLPNDYPYPTDNLQTDRPYTEQELNDLISQKTDDRNDELSDILLVLDQEKKEMKAVKGIDENGELETVPAADEHNNDFLKLDRNGDVFSNFFSNFINQAKDPTRFRFFKVSDKVAETVAKIFNRNKDNPEHAIEKVLKKHEIDIPNLKKILEKMEQEKNAEKQQVQEKAAQQQNSTGTATEDKGMKAESKGASKVNDDNGKQSEKTRSEKPENASSQAENEHSTQKSEGKAYRYNIDQIDWESVKGFGLSKEKLERNNVLDVMLQGYKSPHLHYVSTNTTGVVANFDARLSFRQREDGSVYLAANGIKREPEFAFAFMGHSFTEEDKVALRETKNMGRTVDLVHPNTGEVIPSIISLDHLTNEFIACPQSKINIPDEISNKKLSNEEKADLQQGKAVLVKDMISKKGTKFDAVVQFNADKRFVEYLFGDRAKLFMDSNRQNLGESMNKGVPDEFRKVPLTQTQQDTLREGGTVYVSGIVSAKSEKIYDGYLAWDGEKNRPNFVIANKFEEAVKNGKIPPYEGEAIRQVTPKTGENNSMQEVPESFRSRILTEKERSTLGEGGTIYLDKMVGKSAKNYQGYLTLDPVNGTPKFMFPDEYHKRLELGEIQAAKKESVGQGNKTDPAHKGEVPDRYKHHDLSPEQRGTLKEGGTIQISGIKDKNGQPYTGYVTWEKEKGFKYRFPDQYAKAVTSNEIKPVNAHATQVAVNSEGKTNEATKAVKEPLKSGQNVPTEAQNKKMKEAKVEQQGEKQPETKKSPRKTAKHKM